MKHRIYTTLAVSLCLVALSCSDDSECDMMDGVSNAIVQTADFTPTDGFCDRQTRSAIDPTFSPIAFSWADGDKLAVYAVNGTSMTNFDLSEVSANTSVATFKASGFNLKGGEAYLAFSPYDGSNTNKTSVVVSYDGICQEGNGTYSHLGAKDYQWAKATAEGSTDAANINFMFTHAGAVCRFRINGLPQGTRFGRMDITCDGIITRGTIDLTQATPSIVAASGNSTTQSVKLGASSIRVDATGTLTVYTMMAPANLSGKSMTLSLYSGDMKLLSFNVNGKDMQAGKAYGYSATYTAPSTAPSLPAGLGYVDLGLQLNGEPVLFANQVFSANGTTAFPWSENDPVTAAWGLNWRTPTDEELTVLFQKQASGYPLTWQARQNNGNYDGVTVTNSEKGSSLFLPLPMKDSDDFDSYYAGYYWCSKANGSSSACYHNVVYSPGYRTVSTGSSNNFKSSNYVYLPIYMGPISQ